MSKLGDLREEIIQPLSISCQVGTMSLLNVQKYLYYHRSALLYFILNY